MGTIQPEFSKTKSKTKSKTTHAVALLVLHSGSLRTQPQNLQFKTELIWQLLEKLSSQGPGKLLLSETVNTELVGPMIQLSARQ